MSSIADIRAAIASRLDGHYSPKGWNVSPYLHPKPEPPWLDITVGPINYDLAMRRGNDDIRCTIRAIVQWGDITASQDLLDEMIDLVGVDSLKTVLEAENTLGGVVSAIRVSDVSEPKLFNIGAASPMPGVDFTVLVTPNP